MKIKKSLRLFRSRCKRKGGPKLSADFNGTGEKDSVTSHHISFNFCYFHVGLLNE